MGKTITSYFIVVIILFSWTDKSYGQNSLKNLNTETFLTFDKIVGNENTAIFNGVEYIESHRIVNNKHKFYQSFDFIKGTIIYDGQPFFEVPLKYNVFEDLVLVQLDNRRGKNTIQLYRNRLDGFKIGNHEFVNLRNISSPFTGIHELIFENSEFRVFKKYILKEKTLLDKKLLYHEFEPDEPLYVYQYNGRFEEVSLKNLINTFPGDKGIIRELYRSNKKNRKDNSDIFMQRLFQEISKKGVTE